MVWSVVPKAVCGDTAFFGSSLDQFWDGRGVKKIPTGPNTPWPNRAEGAVRLFTLQLKKIADTLYLEPDALPNRQLITAEQLVLRAQWARNTSVTYGGRTPIEIATGRRPPDVVNVENEDFCQKLMRIQGDSKATAFATADKALQQIALRAHLEARQVLDLQKDLAAKLMPSQRSELNIGESAWYWQRDANKVR